MTTTIVVATRNEGKLREYQTLLLPLKTKILSLKDVSITEEVEESGRSFAENAREKAIAYSRLTDLPVLADDSGLEVEALGGKPGIHSARYAGPAATDPDRIRKLLDELAQASGTHNARFVCAIALARKGNMLLESEGECRGIIISEPRGSNGFGYDPIFLFPDLGKTFAELTDAEKNLHSHRSHAVAALIKMLTCARSSAVNS